MKFIHEIELRGDDQRQYLKLLHGLCNECLGIGAGDAIVGKFPPYCWIAEINGEDRTYGFKRAFVKQKKDYSRSNSKGSRGVYAIFFLDDGKVYEINDGKRRYFAVASGMKLHEIAKEQVAECLRNTLA